MKTIKSLLIFLYGAYMASSIWIFSVFPVAKNDWVAPFIFVFIFACIITIVYTILWLLEHWDED